jgi:hypothetical protein
MKCKRVNVSYREPASKRSVSLGTTDIDVPETLDEAIDLVGQQKLINIAADKYTLEKKREFRRRNRPRTARFSKSVFAVFRQLSEQEQEEVLKKGGVL